MKALVIRRHTRSQASKHQKTRGAKEQKLLGAPADAPLFPPSDMSAKLTIPSPMGHLPFISRDRPRPEHSPWSQEIFCVVQPLPSGFTPASFQFREEDAWEDQSEEEQEACRWETMPKEKGLGPPHAWARRYSSGDTMERGKAAEGDGTRHSGARVEIAACCGAA